MRHCSSGQKGHEDFYSEPAIFGTSPVSQRRAPPCADMKEIPALGVASERALSSAENNTSVLFPIVVAQIRLLQWRMDG